MPPSRWGRAWFVATLVVAGGALLLQLGVIVSGESILDTTVVAAPLGEQIRRFFSYFTIQSNLLVVASMILLLTPRTQTRLYRVVRLAALIGITVTGVVAAVALPPDARYSALNLLCDRLLHIVVPVLTVVGWVAFGPRGYVRPSDLAYALAWPVLWLVATLGLAPLTHWYPYPFLDAGRLGPGPVLLTCLLVALVFFLLAGLAWWGDRRLPTGRGPSPEPNPG